MPNRTLHIRLFNKTSEHLVFNRSETTSNLRSNWKGVPQTIPPYGDANFVIVSPPNRETEGSITFDVKTDVDDIPRACVKAWARCSFFRRTNKFHLDPIQPKAVYVTSFRGRVGKNGWRHNSVAPRGSPISIECSIEYATNRYRFQLVEIAAKSDIPVRNSRDELVSGTHYLWRSDSAADWADDNRGSYAPNVFAYKSDSPVTEAGHLDVTIKPLDIELVGAEVIVYGSIDGIRTLRTDNFYVKTMRNVTVSAYVIDPTCTTSSFSKNADIAWSMELCQSLRGVLPVGPSETHLELYWLKIADRSFCDGLPVPVELLRAVFGESLDCNIEEKVMEVLSKTNGSDCNAAVTQVSGT
ncbi:hypothetical protein F4820DRAFT_449176 [Hypoxylon rubiginosum]|uniref:Uncharacterized protein n=1 Tax=Hypoxylon rubiginosum TaxID=110542 RepID=A0ACB9YY27_9PEZI|nr:hypothetical protein F4820DRAFT_449176 [Hypoxylon rubiginosum]